MAFPIFEVWFVVMKGSVTLLGIRLGMMLEVGESVQRGQRLVKEMV